MDILPALKHIEYLLFSRHGNGHGIHSPFVFEIVTDIFRNKIDPDIVFKIEMIRRRMISDRGSIIVNDLGSGSKRMKSCVRKVSDIARYSAVSKKYGIFLSRMSKFFGDPLILELGTSLGISTMYLASASPATKVFTIEGCPNTTEIARRNFRDAGLSNITIFNGAFEELLPEIMKEKSPPGLVFIDGNHRKEPVINYFSQVADLSSPDTVVIFDDINSTVEMEGAWDEIKNHSRVTFTIDIFRMGIVFFREGINHFHYVIRY